MSPVRVSEKDQKQNANLINNYREKNFISTVGERDELNAPDHGRKLPKVCVL